jgi:toxin ParE1/3/4
VAQFTRTAAAERDLSEIWEYIAEDSETAADKTLRAIHAQCHVLGQYPKIGRDRSDIVPGVRSFPVGKCLIFYRETGQGVEIIRVLHGARNLDFIDFDSNM